jgi:hypothetical protein
VDIGNGRKDAPEYRFLAIREPYGNDPPHIKAPNCLFQRKSLGTPVASNFVTNRLTMPGDAVTRSFVGTANAAA